MMYSELVTIMLAYAGITCGAFFGAVGNKLVTVNYKTSLKYAFYVLGILSIISGLCIPIFHWNEIELVGYIITFILIIMGIIILFFTFKHLDKKHIYRTSELAPIINDFTSNADHNEIKLFGGDLSFFGESITEINKNLQYIFLRDKNFRKILILCEEPTNNSTRIRYGKILEELSGSELKFYEPEDADLSIRGRLKTVSGVTKLLIYSKITSGKYQAIETDTANSNGALYSNIWDLVWTMARPAEDDEIKSYINTYKA